ncbi:MAG TPA: efflux RND transporter periplasmic adaptor subunit [Verrucomicrobiae bacterium]|nr:efflux RND transporter periplasmic adaptor subunit [Verrucomicrobiae bacterium]
MKTVLIILIVAAVAGGGGWYASKHLNLSPGAARQARKILYYQSPMHPWIKSDHPGNCTICGMKLVPVYEGEKGFAVEGVGVTLSSNVINVIHVATEEVKKGELLRTLRVAGMIEDDDRRHRIISAYVGGRIEKLAVNYIGAHVKAGDPLAVVYSPALLTAEREYLALAEKGQSQEGKRWLDAAAQRLRRLGLTDEQIAKVPTKTGDNTEILAPMSGTVVSRFVYEGQYVSEGEKLFEIADFSKMWFMFDAYERDLAWIRQGQEVEVVTPAAPDKVFHSTISFIDPNLNDMSRSTKVRVELDNPLVGDRHELYHRVYAEGRVKIEQPEALLIPRTAVLNGGGKPIVYVDAGSGRYEPRELKLGREGDEFWEVLEGVTGGEKVVINGNLLIDAQAQLNGVVTSEPKEQGETPESLTQYFTLVDGVTAALAADDLGRYNKAASKLHAAMPALMEAADAHEQWRPILKRIADSGHLESASDLRSARKAFLPLSAAVADLAKASRAPVKIYSCPMVDQAVPGAANPGLWIQIKPPMRNPFFGAEMLECGSEVKP